MPAHASRLPPQARSPLPSETEKLTVRHRTSGAPWPGDVRASESPSSTPARQQPNWAGTHTYRERTGAPHQRGAAPHACAAHQTPRRRPSRTVLTQAYSRGPWQRLGAHPRARRPRHPLHPRG
eukprot:347701-Chlamydomonas_euryale.AAC.23